MLAHVTKQPYRCMQKWILLPLLFLVVWVVCFQPAELATDMYLLAYATATATFCCMKAVIVLNEIAHALHIWCFDIVTPRGRVYKSE
jgi:hypothetical protein